MSVPLNWGDIGQVLVLGWIGAFIYGSSYALTAWRKGLQKTRIVYAVLLGTVQFGTLFSIFGIAYKLRTLGVISWNIFLFIPWLAIACAASTVYVYRILNPHGQSSKT